MNYLSELVSLVKQKKELSPLDDEFVANTILKEEFVIDSKYSTFDKFKRSKQCKQIISNTRKRLRDSYGLFLDTPLSLNHIQRLSSLDTSSLLEFHKSTQERSPYYNSIYPMIFEKLDSMGLKTDFVLADFACGYNPLAYTFIPRKPSSYIVCDLSTSDMFVIQSFFDKFDISGSANAYDLLGTSFSDFISSKKLDVCFLFKALDPLEQVKRHSSKKLLSSINSSFFVVSFSLFSIGGKVPIPMSKRSWFEKFITKQGWTFQTLQIPNEFFYIIKTS
jgi:hypothetical protein